MPRRKNTDGEAGTNNAGQPVKQPRVRKKKEQPSSICSTPTGEQPAGGMVKVEQPHSMGAMPPPGYGGPMDGPMPPHMMMTGGGPPPMHMQHLALPNGTQCGPHGGPAGPHGQQMMDDGNNGPGGMGPPYGGGPHPQGPPFDFYQQGPVGSGPPPPPPHHFVPPPMPMYSGGQPPQMMMQQQQAGPGQAPPQMGPNSGPPGQFHPSDQDQPHSQQQQMMHQIHPHPMSAQPGPGPMPAPSGPQMPPPPHQIPPPAHPMFPGPFLRQPGPLMLIPPPSIPQPPFLEFRIQEMNRRLYQFHCQFYQQAPTEQHNQWWDAFSQEFFDDIGRITLVMHEYSAEQGILVPKQYAIPRQYVPRFYRSLFTNGVSQLHYLMRSPAQEMIEPQRMQNPEFFGCCALSCENLLMVTHHQQATQSHHPLLAEVHTDCRFYVEFAPFHHSMGYRIRHWFMELRSHQEFYGNGKDGMNHQLDGAITSLGLPFKTHSELKMWQIVQEMEPIVERAKDANEPPQLALHQIVLENGTRMEMERHQRMAQAQAAAQIQAAPHNQQQGPGSAGGGGPMSQPHQHAGMMVSGMGPPQMPPPMAGMLPSASQMGGGPPMSNAGHPAQPPQSAEEPKPKPPKRQRSKKQNPPAALPGGGANSNSPTKGKKGPPVVVQALPGQQTPPAGMPPMGGFPMGAPAGQFHPGVMPPPGHHDVLTVGEPSMMGCEYGEQDERQISRVENIAFAGMNHPNVSQGGGGLMLPPPGMSMAGPIGGPPGGLGQQMSLGPPRQMGENVQAMLGDFDMHQQQLQPPPPSNSMWGPPPTSDPAQQLAAPPQQAMSTGGSS